MADKPKKLVKSEEKEKKVVVNTLGIIVEDNNVEFELKKTTIQRFKEFMTNNPVFGVTIFLAFFIFVYMLAVFSRLTEFHYIALVITVTFMMWISLVEDARIGYKFFSVFIIFVSIIVFLSI